nr:hypothetical protein BaRGS_025511 [Batillaria attramentaria]
MSNSVPLTNGDNTGMVGPEPSSKDPPVVEKRVRFAPQFVMADRFGEDTGTPPPPSVCLPPSLVSVSTGEHSDKAVQCDFDDIIWALRQLHGGGRLEIDPHQKGTLDWHRSQIALSQPIKVVAEDQKRLYQKKSGVRDVPL